MTALLSLWCGALVALWILTVVLVSDWMLDEYKKETER
jgi:hypothetical protein